MKTKTMLRILLPALACALVIFPILGGCANSSATTTATIASYTIKTASKTGIGDYLVNAGGMTLYYWAKDVANKSNASGSVLTNWPVFYAANISIPSNLDAADFGTITRDDGAMQTTYYGWPLYLYSGDKAAGDTAGDGVGGTWFVDRVDFYSVMLMNNATLGSYLADENGKTLYYYTKDSPGKSTATGGVLANWPVFNPPNFAVPSTLNASDFATITRDDGAKQATYKGWPLYYYAKDMVSGDTLGQGVGSVWYVIVPATFAP